jgi:hypothetical protein
MSEDLVTEGETVHSTDHPSILGLNGSPPYSRAELDAHLQRLQSVSSPTRESRERLRKLLLNTRPDGRETTEPSSPSPSSIEL